MQKKLFANCSDLVQNISIKEVGSLPKGENRNLAVSFQLKGLCQECFLGFENIDYIHSGSYSTTGQKKQRLMKLSIF